MPWLSPRADGEGGSTDDVRGYPARPTAPYRPRDSHSCDGGGDRHSTGQHWSRDGCWQPLAVLLGQGYAQILTLDPRLPLLPADPGWAGPCALRPLSGSGQLQAEHTHTSFSSIASNSSNSAADKGALHANNSPSSGDAMADSRTCFRDLKRAEAVFHSWFE